MSGRLAETIGKNIKQYADKRNANQTQLAEVAGVSQAFISNVIKGLKTPSVEMLLRVAKYLDVTLNDLVA